MKTCQHCGWENDDVYRSCSKCLRRLEDSGAVSQALVVQDSRVPVVAEAYKSYIQVIDVLSAPTAPWQPTATELAMSVLCQVPGLKLVIRADRERIVAQIEVPHTSVTMAKQALASQFQTVVTEAQSKLKTEIGWRRFNIGAVHPFYVPLKAIGDLTQGEIVSTIVAMISGLRPNEQVVVEYRLSPPQVDYQALAEAAITQSGISNSAYFSLGTAVEAAQLKADGADRVDKFQSDIMKALRAKQQQQLVETQMGIKVKTSTDERAFQLFYSVATGLNLAASPGFNQLVLAGDETYPLLLSPSELACLFHPFTRHMTAPEIVWAPEEDQSPFYDVLGLPEAEYQMDDIDLTTESNVSIKELEDTLVQELADEEVVDVETEASVEMT